jgi:hypothetical protein
LSKHNQLLPMKKTHIALLMLFFCLLGFNTVPNSNLKKLYRARFLSSATEEKLMNKASSIKTFADLNSKYNTEIAFLIDMQIMSGKNRFFVYNLKTNTIIDQGLVSHGLGSETETQNQLKFSNIPGSMCTALGKYAIGKSYSGEYGKAYRLFGLDETNNKAFQRSIVLHKYNKVPYEEQNRPICQSMGCPMLNDTFYSRIEKLIDSSKKKIILEIYY